MFTFKLSYSVEEKDRLPPLQAPPGFLDERCLARLLTFVKAAMFFAALGQERKLLALAKADRSFVGHRPLSGHEGDISSSDGRGGAHFADLFLSPGFPVC